MEFCEDGEFSPGVPVVPDLDKLSGSMGLFVSRICTQDYVLG